MQIAKIVSLLFPLFLLNQCAHKQYAYEPTDTSLVKVGRQEGTAYEIPSDSNPQGVLRVTSFGVVNLGVNKNLPNVRAMHMRMALENKSKKDTWTVNTQKQFLSLVKEGQSQPAYTNTGEKFEDLPQVKIGPGQSKSLDLYYPLPQDLAKAKEIPTFKFGWQVSTDHREVAKTTSFERYPVVTDPPVVYMYYPYLGYTYPWGLGQASTWWYNPYYYEWTWDRPSTVYPIL